MTDPALIVRFWEAAGPKAWFKKDAAFDAELAARFGEAHHAAARGELAGAATTAEAALGLVLLLDQVPRNIFRNSPHAFATDGLALAAARAAIAQGFDLAIPAPLRVFFYLPFEHAEELAAQEEAVRLISAMGDAEFTKYALLHRDVIARFGRFPHRNPLLGRETTAEEAAFLASGGFAG